jgi:hypothetical protein
LIRYFTFGIPKSMSSGPQSKSRRSAGSPFSGL